MSEMEKEFQDLMASQGELIGSIAHDLKGLLSGIDGGIYLVDSGLKKNNQDRISQGFDMVKRNLTRIRRTVASSLYFVKDREIDWQPIDLEAMLDSVKKDLLDYASHLKVALHLEAKPGSFVGGELPVFSMLVNLTDYALNTCHISETGSSRAVTLTAALENDEAVFEITAEGFCMDEEATARALGPFYSPKGIDRSHLGLFIAHKLVKCHNGSMRITPLPDENKTLFLMKLPATNATSSA